MQMLLALFALGVACTSGELARENPLGQVINLLDSLAAKVTAEGEAEAKAYKEFVEWCDDASTHKRHEIETGTAEKEKLEATIAKSTDDAASCSAKIEDLAKSISNDDADLKDATKIREKEAADFAANEAELVDTVDTLSRAIGVLSKEMAKNPAAFAQVDTRNVASVAKSLSLIVDAASFNTADSQKLLALVQSQQTAESDDDELGAPAAAVYKTHSTNIMDVLEDLKEKAEEQLSALRKAETNSKHNFEMLKQSLEDRIADDTKDMNNEKAARAAAQEVKAQSEADLAETVQDLADAKKTLNSANSNCMRTAADHEATVAARNEELAAIAKAKEILAATTSGAVEQTYSLLQVESSLRTRADLANAEVVAIVKKLAQEHHSAALAQLASRISAVLRFGSSNGEDPFTKVKGLITDLIAKLEKEAGEDADEKAFCDEQMAKTEAKKSELEDDVARLTGKIDQFAAKSASLKADVKETQAELAALSKLQAEMDKARADEHAAYVKAKAELELGLSGVGKALGVLRDYYGNDAAASMLQQPSVPVHTKATGAGQGIIGILEVVESDFAKNLANEETEEADSKSFYDKTTQENSVTKTIKDQDVKYMTEEFTRLDKSVSDLSGDRSSASSELAAVMEYYAEIKERCIAKPETYEERRRRREAEIAGLKQALSILETETALVQRRKSGREQFFLGHA